MSEPLENTLEINKNIVFFDGVCNFCNSTVNILLKGDKQNIFKFSALQSPLGQYVISKYGLQKTDSIILYNKGNVYVKILAVRMILKLLGGYYKLLYYLIYMCPNFMGNWAYDVVAKNRYKWFGKKDTCMVPTPDVKAKFLDT